jgi:hypothetical protein
MQISAPRLRGADNKPFHISGTEVRCLGGLGGGGGRQGFCMISALDAGLLWSIGVNGDLRIQRICLGRCGEVEARVQGGFHVGEAWLPRMQGTFWDLELSWGGTLPGLLHRVGWRRKRSNGSENALRIYGGVEVGG